MKKIQDMYVGQYFRLDNELKLIVRLEFVKRARFYHVWNFTKQKREEYGPQRKAYCEPVQAIVNVV